MYPVQRINVNWAKFTFFITRQKSCIPPCEVNQSTKKYSFEAKPIWEIKYLQAIVGFMTDKSIYNTITATGYLCLLCKRQIMAWSREDTHN